MDLEAGKPSDNKTPPTQPVDKSGTIKFANSHTAQFIHVSCDQAFSDRAREDDNSDNSLRLLGFNTTPKALITISGGASLMDQERSLDAHLDKRLAQLFSRGIARTAAEIGADLIDGGSDSGVMAMIGQGVADRGYKSRLIGVMPAPLARYPGGAEIEAEFKENACELEPHHSHFVLVDTPHWGGETDAMYQLADALSPNIPVLTVLVNGGDLACEEILRSVRLGWPIIVVAGSGRLADEIAQLHEEMPDFIPDPRLAEIISDGRLFVFPVEARVEELERMIRRLLRGDSTLRLAWERFAIYDDNANRHQRSFKSMQFNILLLGVLGTLLALLQTSIETMLLVVDDEAAWQMALQRSNLPDCWMEAMRGIFSQARFFFNQLTFVMAYLIILIPIMMTAMLAAANRFNAGSKWLLLRGSAEAVKREIFRYRARAEIYNNELTRTPKKSREVKLADQLQSISTRLMQTEVNISALQTYQDRLPPPYSTAAQDEGFMRLSPEQYLSYRIEDQYIYYRSKTQKLEKQLKRLQWLIYIVGGIGTLLAALGLELWIALTGAIVTALGTYLEYQQIEATLLKYNQAATDLANVRSWWIALSAAEQEEQSNIDMLVQQTERILFSEFSGWMQDMQDAFDALREQQEAQLKESEQQGIDVGGRAGDKKVRKENEASFSGDKPIAEPRKTAEHAG